MRSFGAALTNHFAESVAIGAIESVENFRGPTSLLLLSLLKLSRTYSVTAEELAANRVTKRWRASFAIEKKVH